MAQYNKWQNKSLYEAASSLTDAERRENRGAFFKSIHGTLAHLLWGDQTWMNRFAGTPKPIAGSIGESQEMVGEWSDLSEQRAAFDDVILGWAGSLSDSDLAGTMSWFSGAVGQEVSKPRSMLIVHMFNHQTHHRGQVHAMLTQAGAKPDDTDLFIMETG